MHAAASVAADDPTRFEVLDFLLKYDGGVNEMEVDLKGRKACRQRTGFRGTPLHHAIRGNSVEAVTYLLETSASPLAQSWSSRNALEVAESSGDHIIAEIMRRWL